MKTSGGGGSWNTRARRQLNIGVWSLGFAVACQSRTPAPRMDSDATADSGTGVPVFDGGTAPGSGTSETDVGDGGSHVSDAGRHDAGFDTDSGVGHDAGSDAGPVPPVSAELNNWEDFSKLATPRGELKFLLASDSNAEPACLFQNTNEYPYHLQFLRTLPQYSALSAEAYEDMVLLREQRVFFAGALRLFPGSVHPVSGETGIIAYSVYTASVSAEVLTVEELRTIDRQLEACMGELAPYLVYLPESSLALAAAERSAVELAEASVAWIPPSQLNPVLQADVYSAGEAYGYIRRVSAEEALDVGPRDVVVTPTAPAELGIVSALITEQVQNSVSHLNLRLREKRIPNAAAPGWFESGYLDSLEGSLVHVVSTDAGITLTPARLSDAQAFWASRVPALPELEFDLDVKDAASLTDLRHQDSVAFGTKAANLGELNLVLPSANVPQGLALPFAAYQHHIQHNDLQSAINQAVAQARVSSPQVAGEILSDLRKQLKAGEIEAEWEGEFLAALEARLGETGVTTRLRFRSSTNVEDLPGLSGAGLYDSASGCYADDLDADDLGPSHCLTDAQRDSYTAELERLRTKIAAHPEMTELEALIQDIEEELSEEKSARKALRKVWASLWNDRAFQDREYYGIDHERVFMGIAIHPSLVGEQLESVLVTNLEPDNTSPLYRIESQVGEIGVVEPQEPDAVAERLQFRRSADDQPASVTLVTPSSMSPDGESLWQGDRFAQLTRFAFQVHDHFQDSVYPEIRPLQLDVEIDVTAEGVIFVKQARPYVSGGW